MYIEIVYPIEKGIIWNSIIPINVLIVCVMVFCFIALYVRLNIASSIHS